MSRGRSVCVCVCIRYVTICTCMYTPGTTMCVRVGRCTTCRCPTICGHGMAACLRAHTTHVERSEEEGHHDAHELYGPQEREVVVLEAPSHPAARVTCKLYVKVRKTTKSWKMQAFPKKNASLPGEKTQVFSEKTQVPENPTKNAKCAKTCKTANFWGEIENTKKYKKTTFF